MGSPHSYAIVTPTYRGDIERCRLLCASVDAFISNLSTHYLLVEDNDVPLFSGFAGPRRRVVAESELLPRWLKSYPDPFTLGRRRIWTGFGALRRGVMPLRGWHTQQLRKMAIAQIADEDVLLFADADVIMLKPYDLALQTPDGVTQVYKVKNGISASMTTHVGWVERAHEVLGLASPTFPADDYINNLVTWTAPHARGLLDRIEKVTGRDWVSAVTSGRGFSEWLLYGYYIDRVLGASAGPISYRQPLSRTYWVNSDVDAATFADSAALIEPDQVAIGVQSFIDVPMSTLWDVFRRYADGRFIAPYVTTAESA